MLHLVLIDRVVYAAQVVSFASSPDLPLSAWWLPILVLFVLGSSATIDALTGTIPDWIIFLGLAAVVVTEGVCVDWQFSSMHLRLAIEAGAGLWLFNELWRRQFKGDAYGMGDAKWTMLAVSVFDFAPAVFAWGAAAVLAVGWMGAARVAKYKVENVYFGPFLFIGLLIGLYWLKLR